MKKYQIMANITLVGDGWVKAKNKKEAIEKYTEFLENETCGLSTGDIKIAEVVGKKSKYYDTNNEPSDEDFADTTRDCICHYYLN